VEGRNAQNRGDSFMTQIPRLTGRTCVLAIGVLIASSACAANTQSPHRATALSAAAKFVRIVGTVKDASNGVAVSQATVSYGDQSATTYSNGQFVLNLPSGTRVTLSIKHPAFQPLKKPVTAQSGGQYDFALTGLPSVTIKTKTNETHILDIGTAQFAYVIIFIGNTRSDKANFCTQDGSDFTPDKTEFSRIIGPATPAKAAACCPSPVMSANVEMKSGAKLLVYFKDSCTGNEVDFLGREKSTGLYAYFRFGDIAEIDFP
jgi:hypothetical protein